MVASKDQDDGERRWAAVRFRLRHLEMFWAVVRTGSQHEAARVLGLSQPAISKLLRHLEDQMGIALFQRSKGRMVPTPEAMIFFDAVDDIFTRVQAAERLARNLKRRFSGQLTIVAVPGLSAGFVPEAIGGFLRQQADVRIGITGLPTAQVIDRVLKGQAQLGLLYGPVDATALGGIVLGEAAIVCGIPRSHRLSEKRVIEPQDLAEEPLISAALMPRWGQLLDEAFHAAGVERKILVNCANSDLGFTIAATGAGIAVMPMAQGVDVSNRALVLRRFVPRITLPIMALVNHAEPPDQLTSAFVNWLREHVGPSVWDAPADPVS